MIEPIRLAADSAGFISDPKPSDYMLLYVLWCDQGMAHLIEVYDGDNDLVPVAMVMIDFGAEVMKKSKELTARQAAPSVSFVIERLKTLDGLGRAPYLDRVVISHQDADHWSMLNRFIEEIDAEEIPLIVGEIRYGGIGWKKGALDTLKALAEFTVAQEAIPWRTNYSDYDSATHVKTAFYSPLGVSFRVLTTNVKSRLSTPSIRANASSAVVVIDFDGACFILPGDATRETLAQCNIEINKWMEDGSANPVRPCYFFGAPHHGAMATMNGTTRKGEVELGDLITFIDLTQPYSTLASAGAENSFKHPYLTILGTISKYVGQSDNVHNIVVWDDLQMQWRVYTVLAHTYTTLIDIPHVRQERFNASMETGDEPMELDDEDLVIACDWHIQLTRSRVGAIEPYPFPAPTKLSQTIWALVEAVTPAPREASPLVSTISPALRRMSRRRPPVTRVTARRSPAAADASGG